MNWRSRPGSRAVRYHCPVAPAETGPAPDPGVAGPVAKDEPTIPEVAGGDMAKGEPVGDMPEEDGLAAEPALASAAGGPPTPGRSVADRAQVPSPEVTSEPTPSGPEAEKAEADRVLRSKGLRRNNLVYVLDKEDKVRELVNNMSIQFRNIQGALARMAVMEKEVPDPGRPSSTSSSRNRPSTKRTRGLSQTPGRTGPAIRMQIRPSACSLRERARQREQEIAHHRNQVRLNLANQINQLQLTFAKAQSDYNSLGTSVMSERNALCAARLTSMALIGQIQKDYEDLRNDREVRAALSTLNRDSRRPIALGPIENYKANVQKMAAGVLAEKGFQRKRGGGLVLGADADLQMARSLVKSTRMDLAVALYRSQGLKSEAASRMKREADLAAREVRTAADLVAAAEPEKPKLTAQLDRLRGRLRQASRGRGRRRGGIQGGGPGCRLQEARASSSRWKSWAKPLTRAARSASRSVATERWRRP